MSEASRLAQLRGELKALINERNRLERERNSPDCGPGVEYHLGMRLDSIDSQIERIEEAISDILKD